MPAIHQFVAGFTQGDAISNEALVLRRIFRSWGYESEIVSERNHVSPALRNQTHDVASFAASNKHDDIVLLHLSVGSTVNDVFASLSCRKALLYHNVTPAHYFQLINEKTAYDLEKGRRQVQALAGVASVNLADSRFNADELTACGYRNVGVLPLVLDLESLKTAPDGRTLRQFNDGPANVLFVGRCAPNKRMEDCLTAFFMFHRYVNSNSRFIHVGSFGGTERYYYLLQAQARELGLPPHSVHFAGCVTQSELNAFYRCARVFLCMSEHEGFCIPVLESLVHDVPVLAYAAGAVPETLDGAGVLFREKRFESIAEMIGRLTSDEQLRSAVIARQRERLDRYARRDLAAELKAFLAPLTHPAGR